ncbi:uncharacterized protein LOC123530709 [Mercenaria mercenaria]|uniref:uncharacterized protein LOC123530709 n=1 Tax=Mercenaria mercenaria TaxID=6596 RepID=UPI00234F9D92|nr:uncharacterized protein LOC123530709 [Mercenaria mercenaria]
MGEVYDICDDGKILVEFPKMNEKIYVDRVKFEVFDPRKNKVVATREQLPLKPAYALTIHKSQGMTLERVEVDCRDIFKQGQLGVAIGRARSLDGLRVINFNKNACIKQPEKIQRFLTLEDSIETKDDRSCCNNYARGHCSRQGIVTVDDLQELEYLFDADDDLSPNAEDLEDDFNEVIANLDNGDYQQRKLPEDLDLNAIIDRLTVKKVLTPMQFETNQILSSMDKSKLEYFARNEFYKVSSIMDECNSTKTGQIVSKDLGSFYSKIHQHANSLEFRMNCLKLFQNEQSYTVSHQHICFNISVELRKYILSKQAEKVTPSSRQISKRTITQASRARVRYVGGYCIAKVRHKFKGCSRQFQGEKKMAHRKQVRVSTKVISTVNSKGKSTALKRSKKQQEQPPSFQQELPTSSETVAVASAASTSVIPQDIVTEPDPLSDNEDNVKCKICDSHDQGIEWIQCDSCDSWLHRNCAGLKHHMKWKKYQRKGASFYCSECA